MNAPEQITLPSVYTAIAAVARAMAEKGVGKSRRNEQQKYSFRGIDDFYNALAPALATAGLVILPRCLSRDLVERKSGSGNALFYVTVAMEFDFVSAADGSKHTVGPFYGEAMDSGDKATNKAMSAAYKYCVMQAFAIPVEGQTIDSENDTHDVAPELDQTYVLGFESATTQEAVAKTWNAIPRELRAAYRDLKDKAIARVREPAHAAG